MKGTAFGENKFIGVFTCAERILSQKENCGKKRGHLAEALAHYKMD